MFVNYRIHPHLTLLRQTAQVASQQGKYLGAKLAKLSKQHETLIKNELMDEADEFVARPFKYLHMGSLAYIGNAAVFDFGGRWNFMGGLVRLRFFPTPGYLR